MKQFKFIVLPMMLLAISHTMQGSQVPQDFKSLNSKVNSMRDDINDKIIPSIIIVLNKLIDGSDITKRDKLELSAMKKFLLMSNGANENILAELAATSDADLAESMARK
ncbi:hypothetical protein [Candidatus Chromulinivorax destructor]|uniref:Uncharacterized protein n=1 Tax=Candidatus Chromulinivorax destructor TaxID=2066483 RepID=A0A345ZBD0_9BACT|nr:hypothetical protein [Candidatus Chromulinivorax destructor]AXK60597.1 hypothetical protein C0J27_02460 [Candidatus Chromulinivorax destructor]